MNKYTSLKLSKWLQDNGFKGESECCHLNGAVVNKEHWEAMDNEYGNVRTIVFKKTDDEFEIQAVRAYDILNDLCCKYAKEIFGEEYKFADEFSSRGNPLKKPAHIICSDWILAYLKQNKKDEAEKYIMEVSILNPKNKL